MKVENGVFKKDSFENNTKFIVKIPKGVRTIDDNTSYLNKTTKRVILPKSIEVIGNSAFADSAIKHINLPSGLREIQPSAFYGSSLKSVYLPNSVTYVGQNSFSNCNELKRVRLSNNLVFLGQNAFSNSAIVSVNVPDGIREIQEKAFYNCKNLRKAVIADSVEEIGDGTFQFCFKLRNVKLPQNLKVINNLLFKGCYRMQSIEIPESVEIIGTKAFNNCSNLKEIKLPQNLKKIYPSAFNGSGLKKIVIPDSVSNIYEKAFMNCSHLSEVTLPKGLESLPDYAFSACRELKHINLPETLKDIGERAFSGSGIESIELPESLESISVFAFTGSSLSSIKIPNGVSVLNSDIFRNCRRLEKVSIPDGLSIIDNNVFSNCDKLTSIKLPNHLRLIGFGAFSSSGIENITIPNLITKISSDTFANCFKLQNINLSNNLTYIGKKAFFNCEKLSSITLPSTLQEIDSDAFSNCASLTSLDIPENVSVIGMCAFRDCENLTSIVIPSFVTRLSNGTFLNCKSLESVTLPNNLTTIGERCFANCESLTSITLPTSLKSIQEDAFRGCRSLESLTVPDSVVDLSGLASLDSKMKYLTKIRDGYKISTTKEENSFDISEFGINLKLLGELWSDKEIIIAETKNPLIRNFYNIFLSDFDTYDSKNFIQNHNFTFFKKLKNYDFGNINYNTYKFFYNLGGLSTPVEENGKTVDYAQKISNFLFDRISNKQTSIVQLNTIFSGMDIKGFKKDFTEFFMKDFDNLMKKEKETPGFISKCYNYFEQVQKTNTSNRGSQRQLKPTIEKFENYFNVSKFTDVTSETSYLADAISPYFSEQDDFTDSVKLMKTFRENNVPSRLLKNRLYDTTSPFFEIDKTSDEIIVQQSEILNNLTAVATNEFSFDWLEKNDPTNLYLGKLCSCCAHLEGAGRSIMIASIINPNVQNLVIRNKRNEIIAKSTLYINPKEGYGVFNNVEIYQDDKSLSTKEAHQKIYEKYMEAVQKFAEQFNKENPKTPLKQINIGDGNNDLIDFIHRHRTSKTRFDADYTKLAGNFSNEFYYGGDSLMNQYVLWTNSQGVNTLDPLAEKISE